MIHGTIFDVDGVLLDSLSIWSDLGIRYVRALGKEPVEGMEDILYPLSMEDGATYLRKTFSIAKENQEIIDDLNKMIEDFYENIVLPKSGVEVVLKYLQKRNIPVVCATSCARKLVEKALTRNHLMSYISHIFYGDENSTDKNDTVLFDMASSFLGIQKEEILVVDDALYALNTAKENGYMTAGIYDVNNEKYQKEIMESVDWYCKDMRDLLGKLQKEGKEKCIQL